jgi:hypothetical protein
MIRPGTPPYIQDFCNGCEVKIVVLIDKDHPVCASRQYGTPPHSEVEAQDVSLDLISTTIAG